MLRFWNYLILLLTIGLALFGIMTIAYASKTQSNEVMQHFTMQSIYFGIALVGGALLYFMDYHFYRKPYILWGIAGVMVVALLLIYVPGIGKTVKGSLRWIRIGTLTVQPIEFVKLLMLMFLSAYYEVIGGRIKQLRDGFIIPCAVLGGVAALVILQPDFGGTVILCGVAGVTMVLAGIGWKRYLSLAAVASLAVIVGVLMTPNRVKRLVNDIPEIANYLPECVVGNVQIETSENGKKPENYQAKHSKTAFKNGGLWGVGLGKGMQKENYLPECHTDFIFAVIGEDFGFIATGAIWLAFLLILCGGSVIAFRAKDLQGLLLAFGSTLLICAQGVANMAVTTNVFPTKGLALPFLSYGGSSLIATFCAVGVLLGVGRKTIDLEENDVESATKRAVSFD